jgi:hypothetical protein
VSADKSDNLAPGLPFSRFLGEKFAGTPYGHHFAAGDSERRI